MNKHNNDEVFAGFLLPDQEVIKKFYIENLPKIINYVSKNSGSIQDAKDVFQDALVITYQKIRVDNLRLNCSLATFVYVVSKNLWFNELRRRKKNPNITNVPEISDELDKSVIELIYKQERKMIFQKHFLLLGASCQQILRLFFSGKSMLDISKLMNYSLGYARKKKFECKSRLIEMIENDPAYRELRNDGTKLDKL